MKSTKQKKMRNLFVTNVFRSVFMIVAFLAVGCKDSRRTNNQFITRSSHNSFFVSHEGRDVVEVKASANMYFVTVYANGVPTCVIEVEKWKEHPLRITSMIRDEKGAVKAVDVSPKVKNEVKNGVGTQNFDR